MSADLVVFPHDRTPSATPQPVGDDWANVWADVAEWLIEYRSVNTRRTYANALGYPWHPDTGAERDVERMLSGLSWLRFCTGRQMHPYEADRRDVLIWLDLLAEQGLSRTTRANALSAVSAFYDWLVEHERIDCTPVIVNRKRLELTWPRESNTRSLTEDEYASMLQAAREWKPLDQRARAHALLTLLTTTGMRVSELVGLDVDDFTVDDGRRVVTIRGKGDKTRRAYVDDWVWESLLHYWHQRATTALVRAGESTAGQPAFTTRSGNRISASEVRRLIKRCAERAGVAHPESVFPHAFRHSVATQARRAGVSLEDIQRQLGHASPATTQRYGDAFTNYDASPARAIGARMAARDRSGQ